MILLGIIIVLIYSRSLSGEFLFDDAAISDMDFPRREYVLSGRIDFDDPRNRESPPVSLAGMLCATNIPLGTRHVRLFRFWRAFRSFDLDPRSLTHVGYIWTWRLAGLNPIAWHVVNLALHMANTGLVFLFASHFVNPELAFYAAILFAVHPHQVAAVSYVSGRAGLQSVFFALAAVLILIQWDLLTFPVAGLAAYFADRSKEDGVLWVIGFYLSYAVFVTWFGSI